MKSISIYGRSSHLLMCRSNDGSISEELDKHFYFRYAYVIHTADGTQGIVVDGWQCERGVWQLTVAPCNEKSMPDWNITIKPNPDDSATPLLTFNAPDDVEIYIRHINDYD